MSRFEKKVDEACRQVREWVPALKRLQGLVDGKVVTLHGTAPDLRTKTRAMVLFNQEVPEIYDGIIEIKYKTLKKIIINQIRLIVLFGSTNFSILPIIFLWSTGIKNLAWNSSV